MNRGGRRERVMGSTKDFVLAVTPGEARILSLGPFCLCLGVTAVDMLYGGRLPLHL